MVAEIVKGETGVVNGEDQHVLMRTARSQGWGQLGSMRENDQRGGGNQWGSEKQWKI